MQVQFETVLFDSADFVASVVDGHVVQIITLNANLEVAFDSQEEALSAQLNLGKVLDDAKASEQGVGSLSGLFGVVSGLFGGAVESVTATAKKAGAAATGRKDSAESRINELFDTLSAALEQVGGRATATADESESVFGTNRSAVRTVSADSVISELSDADLTSAIDDKVAYLIENDPRVKALVANVSRFHSDADIDATIASHKESIFEQARDNSDLTVNQLFASILRGL